LQARRSARDTLRGAGHPFELKINEAQLVRAARDVRTQPQNPVLGCSDAGNPDRSSVSPGYRPLERMLGYFARLQPDESVREIVSPTTKGLIRLTLFCRPLHRRPNKCCCISDGSRQIGYDIFKAERIKSRGALGSAREARPAL